MTDIFPEYPLWFYQGSKRTRTLTILDNNNNPVNLTGYEVKCQIRDKPGGTLYSSLTSNPAAGITISAAAGEITFAWTDAQVAAFNFDNAGYDIFIRASGGEWQHVLHGPAPLIKRYTQ